MTILIGKLVRDVIRPLPYSILRSQLKKKGRFIYAAIDASNIIKGIIKKKKSAIKGLILRIFFYKNLNIIPIFCFDRYRSNKIPEEIIKDSIKLFTLMEISYIQSSGEGEAQCCDLVKKGVADVVVSQDNDCLLYGGVIIIRNLLFEDAEDHPDWIDFSFIFEAKNEYLLNKCIKHSEEFHPFLTLSP